MLGRQEMTQQSVAVVDMSLNEMSAFISDVPPTQLQPQVCQSRSDFAIMGVIFMGKNNILEFLQNFRKFVV